jgi:hypothetical protein
MQSVAKLTRKNRRRAKASPLVAPAGFEPIFLPHDKATFSWTRKFAVRIVGWTVEILWAKMRTSQIASST